MFDGDLYKSVNKVQRLESKKLLDQYSPRFTWKADGQDALLDIGCGTGEITINYILPLLPKNFSRLVGGDVSESMLNAARKLISHPKIDLQQMDIGRPLNVSVWSTPFDHITSFYCLHLVPDQRQAFQNIYDLLVPQGNCLLAYVCSHPSYSVFRKLSKYNRWAQLLNDLESYITPYQDSTDPALTIEKMFSDIGYSECSVHIQEMTYVYDGVDCFKRFFRAVSPFLNSFTDEQQRDLMDDFVTEYKVVEPFNEYSPSGQILTHYTLLVIFARK